MKNYKTYLTELPTVVKVSQLLFILSLILYVVMYIGGGSFTTYYALMLLCLTGFIASLTSLFKKYWLLGTLNLCLIAIIFISFIYTA